MHLETYQNNSKWIVLFRMSALKCFQHSKSSFSKKDNLKNISSSFKKFGSKKWSVIDDSERFRCWNWTVAEQPAKMDNYSLKMALNRVFWSRDIRFRPACDSISSQSVTFFVIWMIKYLFQNWTFCYRGLN